MVRLKKFIKQLHHQRKGELLEDVDAKDNGLLSDLNFRSDKTWDGSIPSQYRSDFEKQPVGSFNPFKDVDDSRQYPDLFDDTVKVDEIRDQGSGNLVFEEEEFTQAPPKSTNKSVGAQVLLQPGMIPEPTIAKVAPKQNVHVSVVINDADFQPDSTIMPSESELDAPIQMWLQERNGYLGFGATPSEEESKFDFPEPKPWDEDRDDAWQAVSTQNSAQEPSRITPRYADEFANFDAAFASSTEEASVDEPVPSPESWTSAIPENRPMSKAAEAVDEAKRIDVEDDSTLELLSAIDHEEPLVYQTSEDCSSEGNVDLPPPKIQAVSLAEMAAPLIAMEKKESESEAGDRNFENEYENFVHSSDASEVDEGRWPNEMSCGDHLLTSNEDRAPTPVEDSLLVTSNDSDTLLRMESNAEEAKAHDILQKFRAMHADDLDSLAEILDGDLELDDEEVSHTATALAWKRVSMNKH